MIYLSRLSFSLIATACLTFVAFNLASAIPWAPIQELPKANIKLAGQQVELELAVSQAERARGLMFRQELPQNSGMLFISQGPARVECFWMKNTYIPLSLAFITNSGTIAKLTDMQPFDERSQCSGEPVIAVLEMNQGWFRANDLYEKYQVGELLGLIRNYRDRHGLDQSQSGLR